MRHIPTLRGMATSGSWSRRSTGTPASCPTCSRATGGSCRPSTEAVSTKEVSRFPKTMKKAKHMGFDAPLTST
jgi:hypothetical protein